MGGCIISPSTLPLSPSLSLSLSLSLSTMSKAQVVFFEPSQRPWLGCRRMSQLAQPFRPFTALCTEVSEGLTRSEAQHGGAGKSLHDPIWGGTRKIQDSQLGGEATT